MVGDLLSLQKEEIDQGETHSEEGQLHWAIGEELRNKKFSATDYLKKKYTPKINSK